MAATGAQLAELRESLQEISPIPNPAWRTAAPHFVACHFDRGAHLVRAGTPVKELYFLLSGLARNYYLDIDGREFNKSFAERGGVLGSVSSLVTGAGSPFSIQALKPCLCLSIDYRAFAALADRYGEWRQLQLHLLQQLVIEKERREADFLRLSAGERYRQFLRDYAGVAGAIPNYHIASYLGITEVALSRIRRRLKLTRVNDSAGD